MRLLLVRHGQTPANVRRSLDTLLPGPELTDVGRQQAASLCDTLAGESVDALYVSRALRTHLTAAPLAEQLGLEPVELPGVHEVAAGEVEQRSDEQSVLLYVDSMARWAADELDGGVPGGETGHDFFARYDDSIGQVAAAGHETAVIVSHGAAIRTWTTLRSSNLGPRFALNNPLANTGVVVVEGEPGSWLARSWMGAPLSGPGIDDQGPFEGPSHENVSA